jgi:general secretion pathway protein M
MSLKTTLNRSAQSLSEFWGARNARERRILTVGTAVALIALIYLLLIDPALAGRTSLNAGLPAMRQQVAQLQALSREAAGMSGQQAPAVAPLSRETLEAGLNGRGMKPQNVTLTGDVARVQLSSASFAGLVDWLDAMQKTALLTVVEANIVALDQPDMVNATLTLRQQKSE